MIVSNYRTRSELVNKYQPHDILARTPLTQTFPPSPIGPHYRNTSGTITLPAALTPSAMDEFSKPLNA